MAKIGLPKGPGKRLKVREKSVKSQGILKWILSGNPGITNQCNNNLACDIVQQTDMHMFNLPQLIRGLPYN